MGYTHYWRRPKELDQETFKLFVGDVKRILKAVYGKIPLSGPTGDGLKKPQLTSNSIAFNGVGPNSHESFVIDRVFQPQEWQKPKEDGLYFDFCKTARKPYDLAVCAVLLAFKFHFGDVIKVSSDGGLSEGEWNPAVDLVKSIFDKETMTAYVLEGDLGERLFGREE